MTLTEEETSRLAGLKCRFNLVISADYQMSKLVPYWGMSAQPGCTYYLQKLSLKLLIMVGNLLLLIFMMNAVDLKILITQYRTSLIFSRNYLFGSVVITSSWITLLVSIKITI